MSVQNSKEVKLNALHRKSLRDMTITLVPVLRIEGKWLEKHGFHIGEMVVITYHKDRLVIKPKQSRSEYNKLVRAEKSRLKHLMRRRRNNCEAAN